MDHQHLPLPPNCNGAKVYQFVHANGFFAGYVEINNRGNADDAPGLVRYSYTSTDGVHWNYAVAPFLIPFKSLLAANNLLFQTRYNGFYSNYVSTDGLSWSSISLSNTVSYSGLAYGSGKYVLAGAVGAIATSTDGNSWNPVSTGLQTQLTSIASGGGVTVAVGGYYISPTDGTVSGGSASPILVSSNGAPFVSATGPTNLSLTSVAYGATNFVAVGLSGLLERSADGFNWSVRPSGTTTNLTSICFGNGMWVAVGTGGVIVTSTNSLVWSLRSSTTGENLYGVTYGNGQFVVVGQQGTVLTSPDGINWTLQFDDNVNNLYKVAYGNQTFVAVGNAGTIVSSPDGDNWANQTSGVTRPIYGVAYASGQFVAFTFLGQTQFAGSSGPVALLRSHDGVSWEKLPSPTDWRIIGVAAANGSFWIAGDNGSILQSDVVPAQPILAGRILSGSGMFSLSAFNSGALSFKIQARTNAVTGIWSDVASITNSSTTVNWTDTNSAPASGRFYRIVPP